MLRRAVDDAKTAIAFLTAERDELLAINADMRHQLTEVTLQCAAAPVSTADVDAVEGAVVTEQSGSSAVSTVDVCESATVSALKSELAQLKRLLKDTTAESDACKQQLTEKDAEIERYACVALFGTQVCACAFTLCCA